MQAPEVAISLGRIDNPRGIAWHHGIQIYLVLKMLHRLCPVRHPCLGGDPNRAGQVASPILTKRASEQMSRRLTHAGRDEERMTDVDHRGEYSGYDC